MKSDTVESLPDTKKTAPKVSEKLAKISLPSKRFRRVFGRPFEAFFTFWRRKNWGERNTDRTFFALAPIFARSRSEKCFKPAESPTETLAKQAMLKSLSLGA